jgi:hypothetical protein
MRGSLHVYGVIFLALWGIYGTADAGGGSSSSSSYQPACNRDPADRRNCLNGVSTSVSNSAALRINTGQTGAAANERTKEKQEEANASDYSAESGVAAGDLGGGWGLWSSYVNSNFDSDFIFPLVNGLLAYSARSQSALVGVDKLLAERFLIGVAFGVQDLSTRTLFNGGGTESDGWTVSPYGAFIINDNFSIDVAGGFSDLEYDQRRISRADGSDIVANFDAERTFVATNLNALWINGGWVFGGHLGALYAEEDQDAYTETGTPLSAIAQGSRLRVVGDRNIDLTQLVVSADVAYNFGSIEPYGIITYRNDLTSDDGIDAGGLPGDFTSIEPDDDDEVELGFGVRYFSNFGITGGLEYTLVEGRDHFKNSTFMLTVRGEL